MIDQRRSSKQSWWITLPVILTGVAAIVMVLGGLFIGLQEAGSTGIDGIQIGRNADGAVTADGKEGTQPARKNMGIVRTRDGEFVFQSIKGMSMGQGNLTVSQHGAIVEIPLKTIAKIVFLGGTSIRIEYKDGRSENSIFSCYWNTRVIFISGDREIRYEDCKALAMVKEIEFF